MPALFFSVFLVMAAFAILLPSIMYVLANMGISPSLSTPVLASYSVAQFLAGPLWGRLSDRVGRKPILLVTMAGGCLSYVAMAFFANGLEGIFITYALAGIFSGNSSVIYAAVTDLTSAENRAKGMGMMGAGIGLAFTFGPALGSGLGGASAAAAGIAVPATASAAACLLGLVVVASVFRESAALRGTDMPVGPAVGRLAAIARLARHPILLHMGFLMFIFTLALAMMEPIMPLLTNARHGWGPRDMGLVFAYIGFVLVLVQGGLVGRLVRRFGERALVHAGLVGMTVGLLALAVWSTEVGVFVGLTCTSVGGALFNTAMLAMASHQASEHERGLVMGVFQSMQALGRSFGPLVTGVLYQLVAIGPLMAGTALMLLSLAWLQVLLRHLAHQDQQ